MCLMDPRMLFRICLRIVKVYSGHLNFLVAGAIDDFYANGVEKGRAISRAAVPKTLIGVLGWCSTSTTEGLFLSRPCLEALAGDRSPRRGS